MVTTHYVIAAKAMCAATKELRFLWALPRGYTQEPKPIIEKTKTHLNLREMREGRQAERTEPEESTA
jgi:hypothetical protein